MKYTKSYKKDNSEKGIRVNNWYRAQLYEQILAIKTFLLTYLLKNCQIFESFNVIRFPQETIQVGIKIILQNYV